MTERISEIIHGWLGWCPTARTMKTKASDSGCGFSAGKLVVKSPEASEREGASVPDGDTYEHTQRGLLIISTVSAAIVLILTISVFTGFVWVTGMVVVILVFVLAIMSTLTVSVGSDRLRVRFGPVGLARKEWPLSEIVSVRAVTNSWYYGWGIRWTPRGPLYNVSGFHAIEVLLVSGKSFRIGTDEPDSLMAAIERAMATTAPVKP